MKTEMPVLLHDTRRAWIYGYGKDGKITISKRFSVEEELDLLEALETQMIDVQNASDTENTIDLGDLSIDERAFAVIEEILEMMEE